MHPNVRHRTRYACIFHALRPVGFPGGGFLQIAAGRHQRPAGQTAQQAGAHLLHGGIHTVLMVQPRRQFPLASQFQELAGGLGAHAQGLLAVDMFAAEQRLTVDFIMQGIGRAVVDDVDGRVVKHLAPVGLASRYAILFTGGTDMIGVVVTKGNGQRQWYAANGIDVLRTDKTEADNGGSQGFQRRTPP